MKKYIAILILILINYISFGQAKKPSLMVIPSRQWCFDHGYFTTIDNFGKQEDIPDYQKALDKNPDLLLVISQINSLFLDRGFPLTDLSQTLNSIREGSVEDAALSLDRQASSKGGIAENLFDKIRNRAKSDILIEIQWNLIKIGPQQAVTFIMRGLDAYSDKQIAGAEGTGQPSISSSIPVMLQEAVLHYIDNFNAKLLTHFDDLFVNGREIKIELRRDESWDKNFETEYSGEELSALLEDWLSKNTVKSRFSTAEATENKLVFNQVRIPMYNANQRAIDARAFGNNIKKYLNAAPFQIEVKVVSKGLGYVQLICGKK